MYKRYPVLFRITAISSLLVLAPGCATWVTQEVPPTTLLQQQRGSYSRVRVVRTDGERVVLRNPVIAGDSVAGRQVQRDEPDRRIAIALSEVQQLQTIRTNLGQTALLVAGTGAAIFLGLLYLIDRGID